MYSKESVNLTVPNKIKKELVFTIKHYKPLLAPIEKDQKVGDVNIYYKGHLIESLEFLASENIEEVNKFSKLIRSVNFLIWGDV